MSIRVFGVTYTTVRQDQFPQWTGEFSATSNPTSTTVTRWIQEAAAELAGVLRLKASSADAVFALGDTAEPYVWCRQTITLGVAARVAKVIHGSTPEIAKDLQQQFEARLKRLEEKGVEVMGPGITVDDGTDEPQGPTSHVDELDLDVGEDDDNESQLVPVLRRDDMM